MNEKGLINKRKHKRFQAQDRSYVEIKESNKVGQILDISAGGLAFKYIDTGKRPEESFDLDILFKDTGFHLENIPFKIVSDLALNGGLSYSSIKTRRCSGLFRQLNQNHISKLEYFIQNYTICAA
jgi:hypothetical protein